MKVGLRVAAVFFLGKGKALVMITPPVAQLVLTVYAILLLAGGFIGFVKAKSHASMIAGTVSSMLAVVCVGLSVFRWHFLAFSLATLLSLALLVFFTKRYVKTEKFMPGGLMAVFSFVSLTVSALAALRYLTAAP